MTSGLMWSRAVVTRNYAILPPEGVAPSVLPEWQDTTARVLAAPAMGARFAEYLLEIGRGGGSRQTLRKGIEAFFYVLEGRLELDANGSGKALEPGGFAYLQPGSRFTARATEPTRMLWLKKSYQSFGDTTPYDVFGNESRLSGETYHGIDGTAWC
jgi:(S)-ureidoglycine aminohydrolase